MEQRMVSALELADRLKRRAGKSRVTPFAHTLLRTRGVGRLPSAWHRRLAEYSITRVTGKLREDAVGLVTIVSHELEAAGAPKVLVEIVHACCSMDFATVVIGPDDGPYADILASAGALVVVSSEARSHLSPAIDFGALSDAIVCNTITCADLIPHLPAQRVAWYLHETGLIDRYLRDRPDLPDLLRRVGDVWVASPLVAEKVETARPGVFVIGASCAPISGITAPGVRAHLAAVVLGSIEARKGQDLLTDAYQSLSLVIRQQISVSFYGRILQPEFGAALIERIATVDGLEYLGAVSPDAAVEALSNSDALIVCSRDEPLPLVAIEALSAGRVLICSKAAGISCYLTDGVDGYVADSPLPVDLANTITRAVEDRGSWDKVGAAGVLLYQERFSSGQFQRDVRQRIRLIAGYKIDEENFIDMLDWGDPDLYYSATGKRVV